MEKIVLYGAGTIGERVYEKLEFIGKADIVYCFCDKNAKNIKEKKRVQVISYEEAKALELPFIITVSEGLSHYLEVKEQLESDNVRYFSNLADYIQKNNLMDAVEFNRIMCAEHHVIRMDNYFEDAEEENNLKVFWEEDSIFYNMFKKLDLKNVVELACGRGRHVQKYIDKAGDITLVDVLEKNIEYTKKRFENCPNVHFYKNNGYDLSELSNSQYTSLFTYDAMVHFELIDIYSYLKDIYRILVPGGYALFHHSNDSSDYKNKFESCSNPHGRNFMDKKIFAFLAYRAGFEIVEQSVIDWGSTPKLDCVSLVRKPE